jgi:hypothetical protein
MFDTNTVFINPDDHGDTILRTSEAHSNHQPNQAHHRSYAGIANPFSDQVTSSSSPSGTHSNPPLHPLFHPQVLALTHAESCALMNCFAEGPHNFHHKPMEGLVRCGPTTNKVKPTASYQSVPFSKIRRLSLSTLCWSSVGPLWPCYSLSLLCQAVRRVAICTPHSLFCFFISLGSYTISL